MLHHTYLYIRFSRTCSSVGDFYSRNLILTEELLKQGYRFHKLRRTFSKLYNRNLHLISKYDCNLKALLRQGISHTTFYGGAFAVAVFVD